MDIQRQRLSVAILVVFLAFNVATSKSKSSSSGTNNGSTSTSSGAVTAAPTAADLPSVYDQDIVQRLTKKLAAAAGCPGQASPHRIWCAVDGFAGGTRGTLPKGSMVGLTIGLSEDFPAEQSLARNVELSGLGVDIRGDGSYAWISSIKPRTPNDRGVPDAVASASLFFKRMAPEVKLEPMLHTYVTGLSASAKYPVRQATNAWRIASSAATDLRLVGDTWVAIEVPPARPLRGIYVSILTPKYGRTP